MREFNRTSILTNTTSYWLAIVYLLGRGANLKPLQGTAASCSLDQFLLRYQDDPTLVAVIRSLQSQLYAIFGEHEKGALLAIQKGDSYAKANPGHLTIMADTFARGISLYAMARETKIRLFKKHASKVHRTIKKWRRNGNPNVGHYEKILNAELAALQGNVDAAEGWYQSAVVLASRSGFVRDAALANERYGEFLLNDRHNASEAVYKFEEACKLYAEWGAYRKVDAVREKYASLWPRPTEIVLPHTT
jgi:hypothetical protein